MTVGKLCDLIKSITQTNRTKAISFDILEREALWETFKVKSNPEDNPEKINDRIVSLQALINAKKQS